MVCPSVLRIGPGADNASAIFLRNALLNHFAADTTASPPPPPSSPSCISKDSNVLTMTNRYFAAQILLEEFGSSVAGTAHTDTEIKKEDGVILVYDALRSNPDRVVGTASSSTVTFDALTSAHDEATRMEQCGELLRLCIGVTIGEMTPVELRGEKSEEEYSRRVLWCLDRGYEYVEADLSEQGQKTGHEDRDKDGFARVVEAITSTMWSSAIMGTSKKQALERGYKEDYNNSSASAAACSADAEVLTPALAPASAPALSSEDKKENVDGETELEDVRKEEGQDVMFNEMEKLLGHASRIREASRAGEMSDEERRKRAGDAAMLLMGLMDTIVCDDDDDDDEESGSSTSEENSILGE